MAILALDGSTGLMTSGLMAELVAAAVILAIELAAVPVSVMGAEPFDEAILDGMSRYHWIG